MPAKKRKNPFEMEGETITRASDLQKFETGFRHCVAVCSAQVADSDECLSSITTEDLKSIIASFDGGKSTNEVKVKSIADHLEAMKAMTLVEEHLKYAKERLRQMTATTLWSSASTSGIFKKDELINTIRFKMMERERSAVVAMVP